MDTKTILCIPADNIGNKLWLKEFREENSKYLIKYKSIYSGILFQDIELFTVDGGKNCVITGDDGTVLYRFSVGWLSKFES